MTTTPLTVSLWFRDGWLLRSADILSTHLLRHLLWTPPAVMVAYLVYLRTAAGETRRPPLEWMLILTVAVLYFYVERGGNQYGPRFHYEAMLFAAVFVAANVFRAEPLADRPPYEAWLFALMVVERADSARLASPFTRRSNVRSSSSAWTPSSRRRGSRPSATRSCCIAGRVGSRRSIAATDLTRNGIDYDGSVLYGLT